MLPGKLRFGCLATSKRQLRRHIPSSRYVSFPVALARKTLGDVRCLWGNIGPLINDYLDGHPDEADLIKEAMDRIASGPRDMSPDQSWDYMGDDLPDGYTSTKSLRTS